MMNHSLRTLGEFPLERKRVLARVDFNVPLEAGRVADDTRIRESLPTLRLLLDRKASIIIMSHLGRPRGEVVPELRLDPVAKRLAQLLGIEVQKADDVISDEVRTAAQALQPGEVLVLENTRFEPGEETNDPDLARELAGLADYYINDAFGTAHRAHASTAGVARFLPSAAGLLMEREVRTLEALLKKPDRPFVVVLGGAKVSDKLGVIEKLLSIADAVLIGGGMANTFLLAEGRELGRSLVETRLVGTAEKLLRRDVKPQAELVLPVDVVVAPSKDEPGAALTVSVDEIPPDYAVLDIGPETARQYAERVQSARTVFWNGPMGVFEVAPFHQGTLAVAEGLARCKGVTVAGGGDSAAALKKFELHQAVSHLSTGGGASIALLEGKALPGVEALRVQ